MNLKPVDSAKELQVPFVGVEPAVQRCDRLVLLLRILAHRTPGVSEDGYAVSIFRINGTLEMHATPLSGDGVPHIRQIQRLCG